MLYAVLSLILCIFVCVYLYYLEHSYSEAQSPHLFLRWLVYVELAMCLFNLVCFFEHADQSVWYRHQLLFYYLVLSSCTTWDYIIYPREPSIGIILPSVDSQILTRLGIGPSQIPCYWEPSDDLVSVLMSGFFIRGWVWKPDCNWRMQLSEALWQAVGWWMEWHPGERMSSLAVDVLSWGICLTTDLLKVSFFPTNLHCRSLLTFEVDDFNLKLHLQEKENHYLT